jgi:hypothetical protein
MELRLVMRLLSLCLLLCISTALWAGQSMTVDKLVDFIRSSLALKYEDGKIAKYLKNVTLTDKLDQKTIESLEAQGAGPKTVKALQDLQQESAKLAAPKPAAPANPITGQAGMSMPSRYPPPPPLDSVRQKEVLDAMRNYAASYVQSLPNYLCVEVIERSVSFNGGQDYHPEDKVFVKLSFSEGRENYKVYLVNNQAVDTDLNKLGGAISSGEFGSLMRSIFDKKSQAEIEWARWGKLRGKVMPVYSYFIDSAHSDYTLDYGGGAQRIFTAYKGLIFADENTGAIARITFEAVDIPATFPIRQATTILDYDEQKIGENSYILPLYAKIQMAGPNNVHTRNQETFKLYQKFGTESNITFSNTDLSTPLPADKTTEQPDEDPLMKGLPPPPPK